MFNKTTRAKEVASERVLGWRRNKLDFVVGLSRLNGTNCKRGNQSNIKRSQNCDTSEQ